jgi:hypothetical protein
MNRLSTVRAFAALTFLMGAVGCAGMGAEDEPGSADEATQGLASGEVAASLGEQLDRRGGLRCSVEDPSASVQAHIERQVSQGIGMNDQSVVTVPVYWHVITTSTGGGNVSGRIPAQMQVLNDSFARARFAFQLVETQVVANDTWFFAAAGSTAERAMKAALRRGGPDALNIYTTNGDVYLGWATFPFYYNFNPAYDGVVLWWAALPGTGLAGPHPDEPDGVLTYDQGDTGTHEVGHWLGLYHTFAGGCSQPGDYIRDTPAEAAPQFFCVARDSCTGPAFPGADPITNFMDYVDDVCMDHFTAGQDKRMRQHWHAFRNKSR